MTALVPYITAEDQAKAARDAKAEAEQERAHKRAEAEAEIVDLMAQAYELKMAGVSFRAMEDRLGVSKSRLQRLVKRHIRRAAPIGDVGLYVSTQLAEIEWSRKKVVGDYLLNKVDIVRAVDALLKLQIREEHLIGFSTFSLVEFHKMGREAMEQWLRAA